MSTARQKDRKRLSINIKHTLSNGVEKVVDLRE